MPNREPPSCRPAGRRLPVAGLAATLALAAAAWAGSALARQSDAVWVDVADAYLELHTGPGRGYPVTRVFARGEHVQVVKRRTDWYLLRDDRGHEGWARHDLMEKTLLSLFAGPADDGFRAPTTLTVERAESIPAPAPLVPAAPAPVTNGPRRATFVDTGYPDADSHRWEAGVARGRRPGSKVLRATLSYLIDENLAVEATLSQVLDGPRDEDLALVGITHTFRPDRRFSPYISAGVGVSHLRRSGILPPASRDVGYAAAGFRYLLQRRLAFRADYRDYAVISGSGDPKETNEWNVGFVFLF